MRTFLIVTLIALLVGVGVGFGMGWLRVQSVASPDGARSSVVLSVEKQKFKHDARELAQTTEEAGRKVGQTVVDIVATKTQQVTLTDINVAERYIKGYGQRLDDYTFQVTADTRIRRQDRDILLEGLRPGETVKVAFVVEGGHNIARTINTVD